ncbi:MAG: hypothetical protein HFJ17_06245 [Clostridia bacterium]|nr:hypothetical protein [Clostridia bacterium]
MSTIINIVIIVLFLVHILWTWNNTKSFEGTFTRISYIVIGTLFMTLFTYIIFCVSKNSVKYPTLEMVPVVRNIILLTFVPVNGFVTLPRVANTIGKIKNDQITPSEFKRQIVIFIAIIILMIIIECIYFKNIQNGIIRIIRLR